MGTRNEHRYMELKDAPRFVNQKVNIFGVILEFGFPKTTKRSDYCCILRIIDENHHETGFSVNVFTANAEELPLVASAGDIVQFRHVVVKVYKGEVNAEVNAVFDKRYSSFALYKGNNDDDFVPYRVSSKFHTRDEDKVFVAKLRKWLINFQPREDSMPFPMFREIKEGDGFNLACKILHCSEAETDKCLIFAWDGTDIPPNAISSKLENELKSPLPLQLEPSPFPRELLCTLPTVGSILRIAFDQGVGKHNSLLHNHNLGKWVKFVNLRLEVHAGLWCAFITAYTKIRYTPNLDSLIGERQRLYTERMSLKSGRMPSFSLPLTSCITVVDHDRQSHATLMDVLTHSEVIGKFKCIVRVVAAMPIQADKFRNSSGTYRMRLTLEDPTARIHALVFAEDGETLFGGYPGIDEATKKLNALLGIAECDNNTPRNPPWVCVCLKSYYVSKTDAWRTRHFRIFDTRIVGDAC